MDRFLQYLRQRRRPQLDPQLRLTADDILDTAEAVARYEADRQRAAFDRAMAEMDRPRLTTETVLDLYVAAVTR